MNTNYFLNVVAGNIFNTKTSPSLPKSYWIGLSKTDPTTSVTEPTNGGYERILLGNLSTPTNGLITNDIDISFAESTNDWGTMTHYVIYDAQTGGNLLIHDTLRKPRIVDEGTVVIMRAGNIKLNFCNAPEV